MQNLESIAKRLGGNKAKRSGNSWQTCCPAHNDKNPSLSIWLDNKGKLAVKCYSGCKYKDIITAIKNRGFAMDTKIKSQKYIPQIDSSKKDWSQKAEYIWSKAIPIHGTPVEKYLQFRGCIVPKCEDLRYLPAYKEKPHAMLARITDAITAKPISLHFTYLKPDGSGKADVEKPKSLLFEHRKKGGVIRLSPDEDITIGLGISEGIETALSVAKYWNPVWAAIDSSNVSQFPILEGIECLTIFADLDEAGLNAARECQKRWVAAGKKVKIVSPKSNDSDWNDVTRRAVA